MKTSRATYPPFYRLVNGVGKLFVAANLPVMRLDEQTVCASAIKHTALTDFGDSHFRTGLRHLLESGEKDANLHPLGRFILHNTIVSYLSNRLRLVETYKKEPDIFSAPLRPPIIITGMGRSGTTFLHNMLASDPAHRALPLWLLSAPCPDTRKITDEPDYRIKQMEQNLRFRQPLLPGMDAIHYMRADSIEECIVALCLTFNSLLFWVLFPVYSYFDWYLQQEDSGQKYKEYRQLLQLFQAQEPQQRLTLKAPAHAGNLAAIKHAIPNAMIIQTHRDPVACITSANSLLHTYHLAVTSNLDVGRMADKTLHGYEVFLRHNVAFRTANPGVVYDVFYNELVADPVGTVEGIYQHFDLPWTDRYAAQLQTYVQRNQKGKHGKHRYTAADFGQTDSEIAERLQFYVEHVGV